VSRYSATPLIVALAPGQSNTIRLSPRSPIATGNNVDCAEKKIQNFLRRLATLVSLINVQAFRDELREELPHVQIFMNDGPNSLSLSCEMPSYSAIDLAEIRPAFF
jgi:hypothetical protein